ncbi:hypothetical protein F5887DRAFT_1080459 [Amanita rubescens]|nr:hypothetical protein F5887DRAFT_1080459 [Amanita rubescens]
MLTGTETFIITTTLQALLTGVYFTLFLLCLRWLVFSDDGGTLRKPIQWPFLIITVILFAFSVTDFGLTLQTTILIPQSASMTTTSLIYVGIINSIIEASIPIITDSVLIFRCWTVYNRSWRIAVLPLLLLLYNISIFLVSTYHNTFVVLTGNEPPIRGPYGDNERQESYLASTIIINIYASSAIILRIWRNSLSRRLARFAIRVIAESGLLYTLTSIVAFSMVFPTSNVGFLMADAINFPTAGIAFNLILIRVAQNRANQETELPTFIGDSTIERAIPAEPRHNSEMVAST